MNFVLEKRSEKAVIPKAKTNINSRSSIISIPPQRQTFHIWWIPPQCSFLLQFGKTHLVAHQPLPPLAHPHQLLHNTPVGIKMKQSSPNRAALIASNWFIRKLCRPNLLWNIFIISLEWGKFMPLNFSMVGFRESGLVTGRARRKASFITWLIEIIKPKVFYKSHLILHELS